MKRRILHLASTVVAASFAAGIAFGAPAHADPMSGPSTTVEMPMPGQEQSTGSGDATYQPPTASVAVQEGSGGVDRDGTDGLVDPDGTNGQITGPLIRAIPGVRARPAPMSPHARS